MAFECCSFIRGTAYMLPYLNALGYGDTYGDNYGGGFGARLAGKPLGNLETLDLNIDHEFKRRIATNSVLGGSECSTSVINGVEVSMTLNCLTEDILKHALFAEVSKTGSSSLPAVVGQSVPSDNGVYYKESFIRFENAGVDAASVVVEIVDSLGVIQQSLVQGIDYEVDSFGIVLKGGFSLSTGWQMQMSYAYSQDAVCIDALKKVPCPYTLTFKGTNFADSGCEGGNGDRGKLLVTLYKLRLSPTANFQIISQDGFTQLTLTGILEKTTDGQWFKVEALA